jgi:hypothetical protein
VRVGAGDVAGDGLANHARWRAVLIAPGSGAHSYRLMHQMRMRWPDEASLMFLAIELLHQDAVDLRGLPYRNASAICIGCVRNSVPFHA